MRARGNVDQLASGAFRVRVYGGIDPLTGRRNYLTETVGPGPGAAREAEKVRSRLLNQVDERRSPVTRATVSQLLDRWLEVSQIEAATRRGYVSKIEVHIRPTLGGVAVAKLNPETLESFYAALRRCSERCGGTRRAKHHTTTRHVCDERCEVHVCRPLSPATVRQIHSILRAAMERAVRWGWIAVNPAARASAPAQTRPNPSPPTTEQASRILEAAWRDPDWGMFVWLAMVTGARRGELCALRWGCQDSVAGVLMIRSSLDDTDPHALREKSTKTHQHRRIALDEQTSALLASYRRRRAGEAALLGVELSEESWMFSKAPDCSAPLTPDSVTNRYVRMCARIGVKAHLHQLRHYSATELISAGVDVRTVAGRLGHSGGGVTTLRVYSAWRSEADQRAARDMVSRLPAPPVHIDDHGTTVVATPVEDDSPYRRIAADLKAAIKCGALKAGDPIPTLVDLTKRYEVAESTAHRAITVLAEAGLISVRRGKRAVVLAAT